MKDNKNKAVEPKKNEETPAENLNASEFPTGLESLNQLPDPEVGIISGKGLKIEGNATITAGPLNLGVPYEEPRDTENHSAQLSLTYDPDHINKYGKICLLTEILKALPSPDHHGDFRKEVVAKLSAQIQDF